MLLVHCSPESEIGSRRNSLLPLQTSESLRIPLSTGGRGRGGRTYDTMMPKKRQTNSTPKAMVKAGSIWPGEVQNAVNAAGTAGSKKYDEMMLVAA